MMKEKKRSIVSDLKTLLHFVKLSQQISKKYIPLILISSIISALQPFVNIIMPKYIIDELLSTQNIRILSIYVLITISANFILSTVNRFFSHKVNLENYYVRQQFSLLIGQSVMEMDFENTEDPDVLNTREQVRLALNTRGITYRMFSSIANLTKQIFTLTGLVALISILDPIIIVVIIIIVLINMKALHKSNEIQFDQEKYWVRANRIFSYYMNFANDFSLGKEVRLYDMVPLVMEKLDQYNDEQLDFTLKLFKRLRKLILLMAVNEQLQMMLVYIYIAGQVIIEKITVGSFLMYVNAAAKFNQSISSFLNIFIDLRQICMYLDLYMDFEGMKRDTQEEGKNVSFKKDNVIEFKNVSFKYPRADEYAIKNLSIRIYPGEKLSVVGRNGAGKSTFIKLLCRLYKPSSGEILLNGANIQEYDYQQYMKLLAVVFQDYKLFSFTIKDNIIHQDGKKSENINTVLKRAGIIECIKRLDKGIDTYVYKTFDKDGIEFSGGESQKLAIARAIYKDAPIVILDEPTAALDPYAEYEIYSHFHEMIGDKTTIYISHRMSSCQFCDKIAVFDKGQLIQYGTHQQLVAEKGGLYQKMFNAQAQYYA